MSYTKGPWKWWTSCSWRRLMGDVYGKERHVLQPTNHPIDHHPDIIVTDADMRLIEAAPELLGALKTTAGNIESLRAAKVCNTYDNWLETVNTAISKAEGK